MKYIFILLTSVCSLSAQATIDGPACDDLTEKQEELLAGAAKDYVVENYIKKSFEKPDLSTVKTSHNDCHDYDGVHSATEFSVSWATEKNRTCSFDVEVAADWDLKTKLKTIDENSKFEVSDISDEITCE